MATIDNNNLPKGVTYQENTGLYVITNSKGQTSRVNADSAAQLNTYNTSWQTGKPTNVTVVDSNGNTKTKEYNPANIIGQDQATTEYKANLTALKRADVLPNKDGTYSSRTTGAVLTDAEVQQKVAAAGLPPNTLEIQKNNGKFNPTPSPATVAASTADVNNVTNTPSGLQPAPAAPLSGTANSPLTVDPQLGATIVKEDPNLAQNAAATNQNIQADPLARTREQRAQDKIDAAALANNGEQQNIVGQKVRAQSAIIRSDTSTPEQVEAATIERDKLRLQGTALRTEEEVLTKQDPATSLYTGVDRNSGQQQYYNPATGKYYLSEIPPTTEQQEKVRDPARGFISQTTENTVSPPAVATAQVPVRLDPPDPVTQEPGTVQTTATTDQAAQEQKVPAEPNLAQAAATTDETIQDKKVPAEPNVSPAAVATDVPVAQKQVEDNDPEGNANIQLQEQNAAANEEAIRNAGEAVNLNSNSGLTGAKQQTQEQAVLQDVVNFQAKADWRVRLSLSPGAQQAGYLYWAQSPGILAPLRATDGVIFPYTPSISVAYNATYDATELTHSNYNFYTYKNSKVESITLGCDFTAQDTFEANYLLAVIHFFRTATKMFYGQDQNPKNGTPPPLCYLSGLGAFQFDAHPLAITGFTYSLPTDVDYIRAGNNPSPAGVNRENSPTQPKGTAGFSAAGLARMFASNINPGGLPREVKFNSTSSYTSTIEPTYVPTKINLIISAVPIVTRNDISNKFSLKQYATGSLLRGTKRAGGGIW